MGMAKVVVLKFILNNPTNSLSFCIDFQFIQHMVSNKLLLRAGIALIIGIIIYAFYQNRLPRFINGDAAPEIVITTPSNHTHKLSDLRGKYVLLQFWGSWCGPCRKENPEIRALYQKYNSKGFEVFSVAIEQSADAWQRAIAHDGMAWPYHGMESADFGGHYAKAYNIHSIPTLFLLDPKGVIVGVNMPMDQMDKVLAEKI
jgi:thiol-disulfide isomerase/thioredoxin